ncbi:TcfC E-set like domain-containing protein [Escherichia coli]|uniref:TcfC E-set like domain-containing protein n=2 Tax=Escherichia coli TaxID=562 RepID=UPI000A2E2E54|nr:TcfC E-set like domain-containing protein [Escherichia coli]OTB26748.1 fimbrial protein [Escherichia coli]
MLSKKYSRTAFVLSCILGSLPVYAAPSEIENIPEGFRGLWDEQDELLEVRLYGRSLGIHRIKTTPTTIRFQSPDNLLNLIDIIKDKHEIKKYFQGSLPRNGNMSCQGNFGYEKYGCNYISTSTVAVILDDTENVLHLFMGERFLTSSNTKGEYYQKNKNTQKAFIHRQQINLSKSDGYDNLFISGGGSLGITDNSYTVLDWDAIYSRSKHEDYNVQSINRLYFRHDIAKRYYYQLGRMDRSDLSSSSGGNFNFNLLPVPDIYGARIGTTQSYIKNMDKSVASPVKIMLTKFSRVEAYRNEQLLSVWYLDSGINQLDTNRLPDGNYDLRLKIFEQDNLIREEIIPFNKGQSSVGDMQQDIFIQTGTIVNDSKSHTSTLDDFKRAVNAGIRLPVTKNISSQQGISVIDNKGYYEGGFLWGTGFLTGSLNGNVSFLAGESARGNYQNITYNDGFSLSFYRNDKRVDACGRNYNAGWSGCYESLSVSLSIPVYGWANSLAYSDTYSESLYKYNSFSEYDYYQYKGRSKRWQFNSSTMIRWRDYNIVPTIGLYNNKQSHWTDKGGYISLTLTQMKDYKSFNTGYTYSYSRDNYVSSEVFIEGRLLSENHSNYRELSARINHNKISTEGNITGRVNNRFGDMNGTISINKNGNNFNYSLTSGYNSSFALTTDGLHWGGNASGLTTLSGSVVRIKSNTNEKDLLKIGGSLNRGYTLGGNNTTFIPVPSLKPTQLNFEENAKENKNIAILSPSENQLFILPGNIYLVDIEANISLTWVGRSIDRYGNSLSGAQILNTRGVILDNDGGFSFENTMNNKDNKFFLLKNNLIFLCPLRKNEVRRGIVFVGEVVCETISEKQLPDELVKNFRVQHLLANKNMERL